MINHENIEKKKIKSAVIFFMSAPEDGSRSAATYAPPAGRQRYESLTKAYVLGKKLSKASKSLTPRVKLRMTACKVWDGDKQAS